jgi:hypothetical protein
MTVDINTDIYPLDVGEKLAVALSNSLDPRGPAERSDREPEFQPVRKDESLADQYDYVMYGRVFKYSDDKGPVPRVVVLISFGGLLMELKGEPRFLQGIELDSIVYLLVRKA